MRTRQRLTWLAALLLAALCYVPGDAVGKGKPGGGGEEPPPAADPAICWTQYERRSWNLKVMNADGTNQRVLVSDVGSSASPSWSADGTSLVFSQADEAAGWGIYVVPADGSELPSRVVSTLNSGSHQPAWSPTGVLGGSEKLVWYDSVPYSSRYDLYVSDTDGSEPVNLTAHLPGQYLTHLDPTWSKDGTKLVASRARLVDGAVHRDLVLFELEYVSDGDDGTTLAIASEESLTDGTKLEGRRCRAPSWGRESDRIVVSVFELTADGDDNWDLWEIDPSSPSSPFRVTDFAASIGPNKVEQEHHADYSPEDDRVVFQWRRKGKAGGIYVTNTDGSGSPQKLVGSADVRDPSWKR